MSNSTIQAVLFDLDGTLADTAADLALALNTTLNNHHRPALPVNTIKPVISLGSNAMLKLAFDLDENHAEFEHIKQEFLHTYAKHIAQHTKLFPGMDKVLSELEQSGIAWGVVTNKSSRLTEPLMRTLQLLERAACIVSGDTVGRSKPHPDPMYHACKLLHCAPREAIYIGDAKRDIEAGNAAGMHTITALYGYINGEEEPENWGANATIKSPIEITDRVRELGERPF